MSDLTWEDYFMSTDEGFNNFWNTYLNNGRHDCLFIQGMGFDPRTNTAIKNIYSNKAEGLRETIIIQYWKTVSVQGTPLSPETQDHLNELNGFLSQMEYNPADVRSIIMRTEDDKSMSSISAIKLFTSVDDIKPYTDVIVDISAMPRAVFLPLLNKLLVMIRSCEAEKMINLHVVVTENSELDSCIVDEGSSDEPDYIQGFKIKNTATKEDLKKIWIPLLGERQLNQFQILKGRIDPVEICPVLPFPSKNLRRGDALMVEYQDFFLNETAFEAKNIVYANEMNPFQAYRLLVKAIKRYERSFKILNGCKIVISTLSSKLLTLSAFMAVFEVKKHGTDIGIYHVESLGSKLEATPEDLEKMLLDNKLVHLWLTGEPYIN